jgi:hypothetical protein
MKKITLLLMFLTCVAPTQGKIAMAISCDDMPEVMWSIDNPAYLLISELSEILVAGPTKQ